MNDKTKDLAGDTNAKREKKLAKKKRRRNYACNVMVIAHKIISKQTAVLRGVKNISPLSSSAKQIFGASP